MLIIVAINGCAQTGEKNKTLGNFRALSPAEERVIIHKGTEVPFLGKYDKFFKEGTYICKPCGAELYHSSDKF